MNEEEMLRLVQSGLPSEQLRAEVTRRLVQRAEAEEPEWGTLLRAAAIPRRLDEGVVGVLRGAPDDAQGNRAALQRLAGYSFVLPDPEGRSYALHEEVRAVLLEDWQTPERRARYVELSRALYDHTRAADQRWEALYHRFVFDPAGTFDEFERRFDEADKFYRRAECGALLLAVEEQAREMDGGQRFWLRYYRARLARVLDRWAEAEKGFRELLAELPSCAEGQGVTKLRTWTLHDLGRALLSQGKLEAALETYQEALEGRQELGDRHGEGATLNNIGIVYQSQGRWVEALEVYNQSLRILRELGDRHTEGKTLGNMGIVYKAQGRWDQAIECYQQDLAICRELGDRHGEGQTLGNLGSVYYSQGRWAQAIECYQESLRIKRELGDRHGEGATLNNLGVVYHSQGRWDQAIECHQRARDTFRELGDRHGEGLTLNNLGNVYQAQGRWDRAIECYQESLRIKRELGDRFGIAASECNLGLVYEQKGHIDEARELIQAAHETFTAIGSPEAQKTAQDLQRLSGKGRGNWLRRVWKSLKR